MFKITTRVIWKYKHVCEKSVVHSTYLFKFFFLLFQFFSTYITYLNLNILPILTTVQNLDFCFTTTLYLQNDNYSTCYVCQKHYKCYTYFKNRQYKQCLFKLKTNAFVPVIVKFYERQFLIRSFLPHEWFFETLKSN